MARRDVSYTQCTCDHCGAVYDSRKGADSGTSRVSVADMFCGTERGNARYSDLCKSCTEFLKGWLNCG